MKTKKRKVTTDEWKLIKLIRSAREHRQDALWHREQMDTHYYELSPVLAVGYETLAGQDDKDLYLLVYKLTNPDCLEFEDSDIPPPIEEDAVPF